jgi:hypothetical protein
MTLGPKAGSTIAEFSRQFQYEFVSLLRTRHSTNRVRANAVYNEFIQDKDHVHMNATRWVTLSGFVGTIGKAGIARVDEDEKGELWIQWVDNTPKTLAKQVRLRFQPIRVDIRAMQMLSRVKLTMGRLRCRKEIGQRWMARRGNGGYWPIRSLVQERSLGQKKSALGW